MATKEHKRQAKGLLEGLESRVHVGPPIHETELHSAREFLRQHDFSPLSDYFNRLGQIQDRLQTRPKEPASPRGKQNYGGEAAGYWMQVQSAYDHVIVSTCYDGEFNLRRGRIKISHRFNQEGRIDFVELKFLRSLQPFLDGALRKLLTVKGFPGIRKDWGAAEAFVLEVLPRELVFLHQDIFRSPKSEVFAWLINIGHGLVEALLNHLNEHPVNGVHSPRRDSEQLCLQALRTDEVAWPVLHKAAALQSTVELSDAKSVFVTYAAG